MLKLMDWFVCVREECVFCWLFVSQRGPRSQSVSPTSKRTNGQSNGQSMGKYGTYRAPYDMVIQVLYQQEANIAIVSRILHFSNTDQQQQGQTDNSSKAFPMPPLSSTS